MHSRNADNRPTIVYTDTQNLVSKIHFLLLFFIVLVGGCGSDRSDDTAEQPSDAALPGVYAGVFPCDGCPGIESTLWLRNDGRYFFRQQYPANEVRAAMDAYSLGRWSFLSAAGTVELKGEGPGRVFLRTDRHTLIMQTASSLEHRLTRDASAAEFSATIRMTGMVRLTGGGAALFTECLTGYVASVRNSGEFTRLVHQLRRAVQRGEPAYAELEGRFSWSRDGKVNSLAIERLISVKPGESC